MDMGTILLGILLSLNLAAADTSAIHRKLRDASALMDSRPDSALNLAKEALEVSTRLRYEDGIGSALMHIGIAEHLKGAGTGDDQLNQAIETFEASGNDTLLAWANLNLANFYVDRGDYVGAAEHLQQALLLFEALRFQRGISAASLNLAEIRMNLRQYDEAMDLSRRALATYEAMNHARGRSLALNRLGNLLILTGDAQAAVPLLRDALAIAESRNDDRQTGSILEALGLAHDQLGDLGAALGYYRRSLDIRLLIDDKIDRVGSYNGIANVLQRQGKSQEALQYAKMAFDESEAKDLPKANAEAARLLYEIHKSLGDANTALRYLEIYKTTSGELLSAENATTIANLEARTELRRKKEQIELLTKQQWLERIVLGAVLILLVLSGGFVVYIHRERQRVLMMADELAHVGRQKDRILSIVSHDLRGPLASLASVLELLDLELMSPDDWKELKPSLVRQFKGTDETLQDLLVWAKGQFEGADPRIQAHSLRDVVNVCEELLDVVARQKRVTIVNDVSPDTMVMCDRSHLLAILRNLLTNAVKFSKHGQTVTVIDGITDGMRIVSVRDEGVGMSPERRDKLFEGAGVTTKGTAGESGSGIGLVFVRDLVRRNKGRIFVESTEGKGSVFTVALPMG